MSLDKDFCEFSADIQCALFIVDKNSEKDAKLGDIVSAYGTSRWNAVSEENWRKGHYKGPADHKWVGSGADELLRVPSIFAALQ